jgi:hypothetical protein
MFRKIFNRGKKTDLSGGAAPNVTIQTALPSAPTVANTTPAPKDQVDDGKKKDHQTTDDGIAADAGKDKSDTRAAITDVQQDKGVTQNQHKTATSSGGEKRAVASEYQSYWEQELDVRLEEEVIDETNYFVPNAIAMFMILRITGRFTATNTQMLKYFPTYCHYATLIYYSVLFYVQILRARRQSDSITGVERKFLKRFESTYKPESLPIAGQLFPFFSTIIATQIADGKYDWIVPQIANNDLFRPTLAEFVPTNGSCFLQPMVPYMVGLLRLYIMKTFRTEANTTPDDFFDDDENAVPFIPDANNHTIFGMDFHRGNVTDPDHILLPYALGVNEPTFIDQDTLTNATAKWCSSKFSQIPFVARRPPGAQNDRNDRKATDHAGATPINNLARFLCMTEEENMEWFDFCIEHATIQAKFSKKVYNLSNVPTVGGNETLILATFKRKAQANGALTAPFASPRLDVTNANFSWYENKFEQMTASFETDRANYDREEELQALSFAPNATLPITLAAIVGPPAHDATVVGASHTQRTGSYFENPERARAGHRNDATLAKGKMMFARWNEIVIDKMLSAKPSSL